VRSDEVLYNFSSGVWYSFSGTGDSVQLTLTGDYDTQITLYAGENCDDLECINNNDDSPFEITAISSVITQPTIGGQTYFVFVHGFSGDSGAFTLQSEVVDAAANDDCTAAIPLDLGVNDTSDTSAATADADLPFCGMYVDRSTPVLLQINRFLSAVSSFN